jgi:hypothetical protein
VRGDVEREDYEKVLVPDLRLEQAKAWAAG